VKTLAQRCKPAVALRPLNIHSSYKQSKNCKKKHSKKISKKYKFVPVHTMKAYGGGGAEGVEAQILFLTNITPRSIWPWERTSVPVNYDLLGYLLRGGDLKSRNSGTHFIGSCVAPKPVWKIWRWEITLVDAGIQNPDRPACSLSSIKAKLFWFSRLTV
jgi:hypothetical protein